MGAIRRFRHSARPPTAWLVVILVAAGFAGRVVATGPPEEGREDSSATASQSRAPASVVREVAPRAPEPVPAPTLSSTPAAATEALVTPLAPPPPVPAPASKPLRRPPESLRRPSAAPAPSPPPDPQPWTDSSEPLVASAPVRVEIPALGVTAAVGSLGLNPDGTLEVPRDFSRAGWYTGRPTPGEAGPAIIAAHRAGRRGPGAFWKLPGVQPGQEIVVTRADGRRVRFVADRLEQHRKDAFPTDAVYGPTPETALRLITCGGPFEPTLGDRYRDNIIVFARMTGWAD